MQTAVGAQLHTEVLSKFIKINGDQTGTAREESYKHRLGEKENEQLVLS